MNSESKFCLGLSACGWEVGWEIWSFQAGVSFLFGAFWGFNLGDLCKGLIRVLGFRVSFRLFRVLVGIFVRV